MHDQPTTVADEADVIVVGAGPGGSATAYHMARHGLRVLLLKGASPAVLLPDLLFLSLFAGVMFWGAVALFRRTL